jgi:hypothetical protein
MLDATQLLATQIAAGVCLLIFVGLAYNLLRLRRRMEASKSWIKGEGDIIASEAKIPPSHRSDDQDDVDAVIRYRYRVSDQTYESDCIKFGGQGPMSRASADALVAKYPVSARVDVYFDPNDPKSAVLQPRKPDNLVAMLVFTAVFGVSAVFLIAQMIAGKVLYAGNGVPMFAFALPLVAFLAAGLSVVAFVNGRRRAKASAQWPTAPGLITTSAIIEERIEDKVKTNDDEATTGFQQNRQRFTLRYRVDLRYVYRVGQRDYVGTTWAWGWTPFYGRRELAEQVTSPYSKGQNVTVYFDPAQPDIAVLEPANRQGSLAPLVFGAICAVAGSVLLAFFVNVGFDN